MSETTVVNIRHPDAGDYLYIGRKAGFKHYGNPFTHLQSRYGLIVVTNRTMAIEAHWDWLMGTAWTSVAREQREWVLTHMEDLRGQRLGCFCRPQTCHGDNYCLYLHQTGRTL